MSTSKKPTFRHAFALHAAETLFALTVGGLIGGGLLWLIGAHGASQTIWLTVTALACIPAVRWAVDGLRRSKLGSDIIAVLALVGTLAVGEYLAGAVIGVMLTGGQLLDRRANRRARRDLSALLSLTPHYAHIYKEGTIATIDATSVRSGDVLVVRSGEVVPVDGIVHQTPAILDESTITGEALPVERKAGGQVRSGAVNSGSPFDLRATTNYQESTYAGLVRLAQEAEAESSQFVRLADRYAALFLPATLLLAGGSWLASGDALRAVAVLVVATPCPLILAAPIAFASGLSRCARRGIVAKGGAALERLARAHVLLFDKTGTVTTGQPSLVDIQSAGKVSPEQLLTLAASVDQVSPHVLASAVVRAARDRNLTLTLPTDVNEEAGQGIRGQMHSYSVAIGKAAWVAQAGTKWANRIRDHASATGAITVFIGIDGDLAGVLLLQDRVRPDAAHTFRILRSTGIDRAVMITGDRATVAQPIAEMVGADRVFAEQTPAEKVAVVRNESAHATTVMVGDGINDAPALAAAGVGVALGARGASASSEAADIVITVDRLERLAEALTIGRRTRTIARQSVVVGMGLSLIAMFVAAAGGIVPVFGAVLQEGIDVAVILNALRALGQGADRMPRLTGDAANLVSRLDVEHRRMWRTIEKFPQIAESIFDLPPDQLRTVLGDLTTFLNTELARHEHEEEKLLYPEVRKTLGGTDPTGTMSREHIEIATLSRQIELLVAEIRHDGPTQARLRELRQKIYELHGILRLHFAQEEENYFVLADQ